MYVALEGVDGAGKTTQIKLLKKIYPDAVFTKEPAGTKVGEKIKNLILNNFISPESEFFLFLADRIEHKKQVLDKNKGRLIISDRSFVSGIAYALGECEYSLKDLLLFHQIALRGSFPDKIVFLKLKRTELEKRMNLKELDKIEQKGIDILMKIQSNIKKVLNEIKTPYLEIDASEEKDVINNKIKIFLNGLQE